MKEISARLQRRLLSLAMEAATTAGEFIVSRQRDIGTITFKSARNPVTETDLQAEHRIIGAIKRVFPDHLVISEESGAGKNESEFVWWIDPLDGTTNFSHGYPHFAVSIALEYRGKLQLGVVYDPVRQELFRATRGNGSYLGRRHIRVSPVKSLLRALMSTGFPYDPRSHPRALKIFSRIVTRTQGVRRDGSAALNLCYLAAGRFDGFWEIGLKPWDTAAGVVILEEAGGRVTDLEGKRFEIREGDVLASNRLLHRQLLNAVRVNQHPKGDKRCA